MKKRRIRWGAVVMTVVLFISCIYGSWQLIRFSATKILSPAFELMGISGEIHDIEETHGTLNGYVDTTDMDNRIRELYTERETKFYNNPDKVIRWFSTTNDFAQTGVALGALAVIVLIVFSWIYFLYVLFKPDDRKKKHPAKRG